MNRTIKEATVKRYHDGDHAQLRQHLDHLIAAYNFGRRLKTLKGLTPYEFILLIAAQPPESDVKPVQVHLTRRGQAGAALIKACMCRR